MSPLRLVFTLAALAMLAGAPSASAASPFTPLDASLRSGKAALGKRAAADLDRRTDRARLAYRQGRWCASIQEMSGIIAATKRLKGERRSRAGAVLAARTRTLQRRTFLRHAAGKGSCGLPKPKVRVAADLQGASSVQVSAAPDGRTRDVASVSAGQARTSFVDDELVITSSSEAKVAALVKRWNGKVLSTSDAPGATTTWLVRVQTAKATTSDLGDDLRRIDPLARGALKVSDTQGLRLLAIAADAAANGMTIAPNALVGNDAVEDSTTNEGGSGDWSDGFAPWYNDPNASIGVGDAWRMLRLSGKDQNRVKLAIADGGFVTNPVDIAGRTGDWNGQPNPMNCSGGNPCPFHGTNVASAAASVVDDGMGVAGVAGQVADVQAVRIDGTTMFDAIDAIYEAFEADAKVLNMSVGMTFPAAISFAAIPYEDATQEAVEQGTFVVASAGNNGIDVDAEDCFIACWEEEWVAPCENDGVFCVGGIDPDRKKAANSNYGYEWTGYAGSSDVDMFAPWTTWVAPDPNNPSPRRVSGTSFSSPFVAGVATMMAAANPSLTPNQLAYGLRSRAGGSSGWQVSRIINAENALKYAFGDAPIPPLVQITSAPSEVPYGGFQPAHFEAKTWTMNNQPASVSWTSNLDGSLGWSGLTLDTTLSGPATHTVTATASSGGVSRTATVQVVAKNLPPKLTVTTPTTGQQLYRTQTYTFEASATDPNTLDIPCSSITWDIVGTGGAVDATGCQPEFVFSSNGTRTVKVTATDSLGVQDTSSRTFTVVDPPLNAPPLVAIVSPDKDAFLDADATVTLKATAVDPDGAGPVTGTWSVKRGNEPEIVLGPGNQRQWKPKNDLSFTCGGSPAKLIFRATDPHGTSTVELPVYVSFPVC